VNEVYGVILQVSLQLDPILLLPQSTNVLNDPNLKPDAVFLEPDHSLNDSDIGTALKVIVDGVSPSEGTNHLILFISELT
jgi:hypothetical protein